METLPFMPFDVDAYLSSSSVGMLSDSEQGQYIRFLCHSWKQGGKLWKRKGDGIPTLSEIACLLRMPETEAEKLLGSLIDKGCIVQDVTGVYYNKRCYDDRQKVESKVAAGRAGGMKSKPNSNSLKNLKNASAQALSKAESKALSKAESKAESKGLSKQLELESELDINTSLSLSQAREPEKNESTEKTKTEESSCHIEPPPGMPKTEEEAIAMAEMAGVPAEFVREKAYPKILSIGFRDGNTTIRHFGQWAKLYFGNWKQSEKRKEVSDRKAVKPAKTLGERRMEAEPWLYDKDIKVREL